MEPTELVERDFFWLVGLLEGEGSFLAGPPSRPNSPKITVGMTDLDVIKRVGEFWDASIQVAAREGCRPLYTVSRTGATARTWMEALMPFMGERRTEQIRAALRSYDRERRYKTGATQLTPDQVRSVRKLLGEGHGRTDVGRRFGVSRDVIRGVADGTSYKHVY